MLRGGGSKRGITGFYCHSLSAACGPQGRFRDRLREGCSVPGPARHPTSQMSRIGLLLPWPPWQSEGMPLSPMSPASPFPAAVRGRAPAPGAWQGSASHGPSPTASHPSPWAAGGMLWGSGSPVSLPAGTMPPCTP